MDKDYPNPGYDIDNIKAIAKVTVEFQVNSRNFKVSKKIDIVKTYLFHFLGLLSIDNSVKEVMSILKKQRLRDNE